VIFFKTGAAAGALLTAGNGGRCSAHGKGKKLARIASNTWPLRYLFKSRMGFGSGPKSEEMKRKYGEITLLDFLNSRRTRFPVSRIWTCFRGCSAIRPMTPCMYQVPLMTGVATRTSYEFDPSSAAGKRWLEKLAGKISSAGTQCQHISNNAPRDICDLDAGKRRTGIEIAKKVDRWSENARRQVDAREQRRPADRALRRARPPTIRRMTNWRITCATVSSRSKRWRIMAERTA